MSTIEANGAAVPTREERDQERSLPGVTPPPLRLPRGARPAEGVDATHWHRRDAILTALAVVVACPPGGNNAHTRLMEIARWIYYGDGASPRRTMDHAVPDRTYAS